MTLLVAPDDTDTGQGAAVFDLSQLVSVTNYQNQYVNPVTYQYVLSFTGGPSYMSTQTFSSDTDAVQAAVTLLGLDTSGEITLT